MADTEFKDYPCPKCYRLTRVQLATLKEAIKRDNIIPKYLFVASGGVVANVMKVVVAEGAALAVGGVALALGVKTYWDGHEVTCGNCGHKFHTGLFHTGLLEPLLKK